MLDERQRAELRMAITDQGAFLGYGRAGAQTAAVLVVSDEPEAVCAALERAVYRMMRVDGLGTEHDDARFGYTSFVSDPQRVERGVYLFVDDESNPLPLEVVSTYVAVIREELARSDVAEALLVAPNSYDCAGGEIFVAQAGSHEYGPPNDLHRLLEILSLGLAGSTLVLNLWRDGEGGGFVRLPQEFVRAHAAPSSADVGSWWAQSPHFQLTPELIEELAAITSKLQAHLTGFLIFRDRDGLVVLPDVADGHFLIAASVPAEVATHARSA